MRFFFKVHLLDESKQNPAKRQFEFGGVGLGFRKLRVAGVRFRVASFGFRVWRWIATPESRILLFICLPGHLLLFWGLFRSSLTTS